MRQFCVLLISRWDKEERRRQLQHRMLIFEISYEK
jgi:hypothetical protein